VKAVRGAPSSLPRRISALASALAVTLALGVAPFAHAQSPLPERDGSVANGTDLALSAARIDGEFQAAIGEPFGFDGLYLMVPDCRPDPEVYLDQALAAYGLAAADGQLDDGALVWFVCTETPRFAGFFWSDDNPYAEALDEDDVVDAMIAQLADGNVTGAAVDGIEVVAEALAAGGVAPDEGGLDDGASRTDGAVGGEPALGDAELAGSEGRESGGLFGGIPAWALVVAAALVGYWWWRRRERASGAPGQGASAAPAPGGPVEAADPLADALAALDARLAENPPALARLILLHQPLGEAAMLALHERHETMLARAASLRQHAAELRPPAGSAEVLALPPGSPEHAAATAEAEDYAAALAEARALLAYVDGLPAEAEHAEMLEDRAPVLAVEAQKALDAAATRYAAALASPELASDGLPSALAALAFPRRLAELAEAALSSGRRLEAGERAEDAAGLAERVAALVEWLRDAERAVAAARSTFDQVDDYAEASWADIRGNGSEADESLDAAARLLHDLVALDPGALDDDPAVGFAAGLARVTEEIDRARDLAAAIGERLAAIRAARDGAPRLVDAVAAEIAQARAWLARPEVAREVGAGPAATLDALGAELDAVRAVVGASAPDWLAVRRRLDAADQAVDAVLGEARASQARVQARRRQLETSRVDAEAALAKAEQYAAAHRRDVGGGASARLIEARAAAARALEAERALDDGEALDEALLAAAEAWRAVDRLADAAYEEAAGDVRAADGQRQAYHPRAEWLGPVVDLPVPRRSTGGGIFDALSGGFGGFGGLGGSSGGLGGGRPRSVPRPSAWGGRSSGRSGGGGSSGGSGSGRRSSGGGSSTRRGGGRGW